MLLIREEVVRQTLSMASALEIVGQSLRWQASGEALNRQRTRIRYSTGLFHFMAAAVPVQDAVALKAYTSTRHGTNFVVLLFDASSAALLAVLEADWLGRIRTGAATGVASRALARPGAVSGALIGAGGQAETQLEAMVTGCHLEHVSIYSRDANRRDAFIQRMKSRVECGLTGAPTAQSAVEGADVVATITTSTSPVIRGEWLKEGTHVTGAGANTLQRREIDLETLRRASCIATDAVDQARLESSALCAAVEQGTIEWSGVIELGQVLTGAVPGRQTPDDITVFLSHGIAVEDAAAARHVYDRARAEGLGEEIRFGGVA